MIYAATPEEIASRRNAFIRKWRMRHRAVADSPRTIGCPRADGDSGFVTAFCTDAKGHRKRRSITASRGRAAAPFDPWLK